MAKYNIHRRKSALDKNTEIVNVKKEKTISETLLGSDEADKSGLKSGKYRVHTRDSILDKNTKIVNVTREKTVSETLFGTEEEREEKDRLAKQKYKEEKENDKKYIEEQNQKMIDSYNEIREMDQKMYEKQKHDRTVVDEDYSEDITYEDVKKKEKEFDYKNVKKEDAESYLKFVSRYLNSRDKGYTIDRIIRTEKKKTKIGPKYWIIKTDTTEKYMNVGAKIENKSIILDEDGKFWRLTENKTYGGNKPVISKYFSDSKDFDWELVCLDIFMERQKVGLNLEKYLKMSDKEKEDIIKREAENWTEASLKLKETSIKKAKNEKIKKNYNTILKVAGILSYILLLAPIGLAWIQAPLVLVIIVMTIVSAIYGYTKQYKEVIKYIYGISLFVTTVLILLRGKPKIHIPAGIMVVASLLVSFICSFIESKISPKIDKLDS